MIVNYIHNLIDQTLYNRGCRTNMLKNADMFKTAGRQGRDRVGAVDKAVGLGDSFVKRILKIAVAHLGRTKSITAYLLIGEIVLNI